MSTNLLKAADDARRLLRGFTALADVAAALEQVGQLEQRRGEVEAQLIALRADVETAKRMEADSLAKGAEHVSSAVTRADEIVARANVQAEHILSAANADAEQLLDAAQVRAANADRARVTVEALADAAQATRDALEAECTEIEKRAEKARAYLAKLKD